MTVAIRGMDMSLPTFLKESSMESWDHGIMRSCQSCDGGAFLQGVGREREAQLVRRCKHPTCATFSGLRGGVSAPEVSAPVVERRNQALFIEEKGA